MNHRQHGRHHGNAAPQQERLYHHRGVPPQFPGITTIDEEKEENPAQQQQLPDAPDPLEKCPIKVFLRFRPMNKLETSRRSRNCIEIDGESNNRSVRVDSPLDGEFCADFDHVFGEDASQSDVYDTKSVREIGERLLDGYNCALVSYGQSGTGKTHTMMGVTNTMIPSPRKEEEVDDCQSVSSREDSIHSSSQCNSDDSGSGMIPRIIRDIFKSMNSSCASKEFTLRCSYVEIYLERILDLLDPSARNLRVVENDQCNSVYIEGASEACCFDEADIVALLVRGNACRTVSCTKLNTAASKSHAIFIVSLEQTDSLTGMTRCSKLHLVDLAGSELTKKIKKKKLMNPNRNAGDNNSNINKSMTALRGVVRALAEHNSQTTNTPRSRRGGPRKNFPNPYKSSKLTRLLRNTFGGNCITTVILTASPGSYNITDTINTMKFGQRALRIKNNPSRNEEMSLRIIQQKHFQLTSLVTDLAVQCLHFKQDSKKEGDYSGPMWESIDSIILKSESKSQLGNLAAQYIHTKKLSSTPPTQLALEDEFSVVKRNLVAASQKAEIAENTLSEVQSELQVLRTKNESLMQENKKNMTELVEAKNELQMLLSEKLELEHDLRTSQFRENEATIFLRQFRKFYRRLLRNKSTQGSGEVHSVIANIPGVPDMRDLIDVDVVLYECGLIEEAEINDDVSVGNFRPSEEAIKRSVEASMRGEERGIITRTIREHGSIVASEVSMDGILVRESFEGQVVDEEDAVSVIGDLRDVMEGVIDNSRHLNYAESVSDLGDGGVSQLGASNDNGLHTSHGKENNQHQPQHHLHLPHQQKHQPLDNLPHLNEHIDDDQHNNDISFFPQSNSDQPTRRISLAEENTIRTKFLEEDTSPSRCVTDKERQLKHFLERTTEKCVQLQIALDQEKANVDTLSNRSGPLTQNRLGQEAIALRQALDRKAHDLQAIIWKMNELHLINRTYNEKMGNRDQHVHYLEECLMDLQDTNRNLILDNHDSEAKLRHELESLQVLVDAMTIPLWQFGECRVTRRSLASRIVLPIRGQHIEKKDWESVEPIGEDESFDEDMEKINSQELELSMSVDSDEHWDDTEKEEEEETEISEQKSDPVKTDKNANTDYNQLNDTGIVVTKNEEEFLVKQQEFDIREKVFHAEMKGLEVQFADWENINTSKETDIHQKEKEMQDTACQLDILKQEINRREEQLEEMEREVKDQKEKMNKKETATMEKVTIQMGELDKKETVLLAKEQDLIDREEHFDIMTSMMDDREDEAIQMRNSIQKQENESQTREKELYKKEETLRKQEKQLELKIMHQSEKVASKEEEVRERENLAEQQVAFQSEMRQMEQELSERKDKLSFKEEELLQKKNEFAKKAKDLDELEQELNRRQEYVREKELEFKKCEADAGAIVIMRETLTKKEEEIRNKENRIKEREKEVQVIEADVEWRNEDMTQKENGLLLKEKELKDREFQQELEYKKCETDSGDIVKMRETLTKREEEIRSKENQIKEREKEVQVIEADVEWRNEEMTQKENGLLLKEKELKDREFQMHRKEFELKVKGEELDVTRTNQDMSKEIQGSEKKEAEMTEQEEQLKVRETELANREKEFERKIVELRCDDAVLRRKEKSVSLMEKRITKSERNLKNLMDDTEAIHVAQKVRRSSIKSKPDANEENLLRREMIVIRKEEELKEREKIMSHEDVNVSRKIGKSPNDNGPVKMDMDHLIKKEHELVQMEESLNTKELEMDNFRQDELSRLKAICHIRKEVTDTRATILESVKNSQESQRTFILKQLGLLKEKGKEVRDTMEYTQRISDELQAKEEELTKMDSQLENMKEGLKKKEEDLKVKEETMGQLELELKNKSKWIDNLDSRNSEIERKEVEMKNKTFEIEKRQAELITKEKDILQEKEKKSAEAEELLEYKHHVELQIIEQRENIAKRETDVRVWEAKIQAKEDYIDKSESDLYKKEDFMQKREEVLAKREQKENKLDTSVPTSVKNTLQNNALNSDMSCKTYNVESNTFSTLCSMPASIAELNISLFPGFAGDQDPLLLLLQPPNYTGGNPASFQPRRLTKKISYRTGVVKNKFGQNLIQRNL